MRDPARIGPFLLRLAEYWGAHPDLRLGQLVSNAAAATGYDTFYVEDDALLGSIRQAIAAGPMLPAEPPPHPSGATDEEAELLRERYKPRAAADDATARLSERLEARIMALEEQWDARELSRVRFIRDAATSIYQRFGVGPAEAWQQARALWDAKPEDC